MAKKRRSSKVRPKTPARTKKKQRQQRDRKPKSRHHTELVGLGLAAVGLFLAIVLWIGWDGGIVGSKVNEWLDVAIGDARHFLPLALIAIGGLMIARSVLVDVQPFRAGIVVFALGLMVALGANHGGAIGSGLESVFERLIGDTGRAILAAFAIAAGIVLLTGASVGAIVRRSARTARDTAVAARHSIPVRPKPVERARSLPPSTIAKPPEPPVDAAKEFPDLVATTPVQEPVLIEQLTTKDVPAEEPEPLVTEREEISLEVPAGEHSDYELPDASVLKMSRMAQGAPTTNADRVAEALVQALASFGVEAVISGQVAGPRVTRYELQLAPGTKVGKVAALKDDLAYALATTDIRILAPIPGKQAVGVEVPNLAPNIVTLGDIFGELPGNSSPLSVWLGKDISGSAVPADLARMPHILIAGTTGSGKSGCLNTMLCSILLRATPDEVRMILVDPKRVELGLYESIPHLLTPVVSSPKKAAAVLANVLTEMEHRYERMSLARARNLPELNKVLVERGEQPLPYLLVVIDELADLMMVSPQAVEDAVIRLAQKSRAVGIHLVLATQRPSVDVITGMIKANVPSRIAFAVSSQTDSRVILDTAGAESLLGQGDMLFKPLGTSKLQRVQGAYVSEEEIALIVEACRGQRPQELDESLLEAPEVEAAESPKGDDDFDPDEDPLLEQAIEVVVQTQTASVSLIQRRLRVGYTRAGRLVDMLERRGIISGYEGSKPRRVLVTEAELERALDQAREHAVH